MVWSNDSATTVTLSSHQPNSVYLPIVIKGSRKYLNFGEYISRRGAALGIDLENLIKSDEEIAEVEQQAQMMGLAQNMGPQAIQAFAQLQGKQVEADGKAQVEAMKQQKKG